MSISEVRGAIYQQAIKGKLVKNVSSSFLGIKEESIIFYKNERWFEMCDGCEKDITSEIPFDIPKDWKWYRLKQLINSNNGLTYKPNEVIEDQGIPVLRSNNIRDRKLNFDNVIRVNVEVNDSKLLSVGDILMCNSNGSEKLVGKTALVTKDGLSFGSFMTKITSPINKYLFIYFNSPQFRNDISSGVKTVTINRISKKMMDNLLVPVPPFEEQEAIVRKINELDKIIDKLEETNHSINRLIDSYEELLLPSIYQYALQGKLVSNIYSDDYGVDVESSIIREGDKYFEVINEEKVDITSDILFDVPSNYKWFRLGDLVKFRTTKKYDMGEQIIINTNYLRKKGIVDYANNGKFVCKGEMVILMDGSNSGELFEVPIDGYLGSTFSVLEIESDYKEYILKFIRMSKNILSGNKRGAAIPHLDKKLFNSLLIPLPPVDVQKEIVRKINKMESVINEVSQK